MHTRDGRPLKLRPAQPEDRGALYDLERALIEDGRGQVRTLEDLGDREAFTARLQDDALRNTWVAVLDHRVVASASIRRVRASMIDHLGWFDIGVHPAVQGLGIGRLLTEATIERARLEGVLRLELFVRADNLRAIALYRSLGFETEVVRRRYVRLPDGRFIDDHAMVRWLGPDESAGVPKPS